MPNPEVRFSRQAIRELESILRYSRREWGEGQAIRYQTLLNDAFDRLASFPGLGTERLHLSGVRTFPVEKHLVIYRPRAYGVFIARVVHHRMNLDDVVLG